MGSPSGYRVSFVAVLVVFAMGAAVADAIGDGKRAASCKGAKVPVTVAGKKSCLPVGQAIPKPKAIDPRLAYLREALKRDVSKLAPGKRGKRIRSLPSGFGATGRRAQGKLLKVLPKALAFLDRRGRKRVALLGRSPSRDCGGEAGPSTEFGGSKITLLGTNGMSIELRVGGLTYRVTFVSCGGVSSFAVPECPTASGQVDTNGSSTFQVTIEVRDGEEVLSRQSFNALEKAKVHGEVEADAKLDFIRIEATREELVVVNGNVFRGDAKRKVRVNMRSGAADPSEAEVVVSGDFGPDFGATGFATTIDGAIGSFRAAESGAGGWSTFGRSGAYCAEPVFDPDVNTLKLKKSDRGQLGVRAKARADGGAPTEARWSLRDAVNASFSPPASSEAAPRFGYTVTDAPENGFVRVTVRVTSTAGVGERTWLQPTVPAGAIVAIGGSFGGEARFGLPGNESIQSWSGDAILNHLAGATANAPAAGTYLLASGRVVLQASGVDGSGVTGCKQRGSLEANLAGGNVVVTPIGAEGKPPYEYSLNLSMPFLPLKITRFDCPQAAQEEGYEGSEATISPLYALGANGQQSADGRSYAGSTSQFGITTHWNLTGSES